MVSNAELPPKLCDAHQKSPPYWHLIYKRRVRRGLCGPRVKCSDIPVRFNPVPPARVEMRKIKISGSEWNLSIIGIPLGKFNKLDSMRKKVSAYDQVVWCFRPVSRTHNLNEIMSPIIYRRRVDPRCAFKWNSSISINLTDLVKIRILFVGSFFHSLSNNSNTYMALASATSRDVGCSHKNSHSPLATILRL